MSTRTFLLGILLFFAMTSIFSTCKKRFGCDKIMHTFQIGVKANPDSETIHIGDTLWLEINTSSSFTDINSNQIINYSNAENLGSAIGFGKFIKSDTIVFSANSFSNVLNAGFVINNPNTEQIREFRFEEKNGEYIFKLGIVPKEIGIFGIGFSNANNVYRKFDDCTKASFEITFERTKQHFYLNPFINSSNIDTTKPSGSYYFKVE